MQTFVTHNDPNCMISAIMTAEKLDSPRLGKQRVEAKQILQGSFQHHPASKMWKGHEQALALYGHVICSEWIKRGYEDSLRPWFEDIYHAKMHQVKEWIGEGDDAIPVVDWPWWFGNSNMVATHRSKLLRKHPKHYGQFVSGGGLGDWPDRIPQDFELPYLWPVPDEEGQFKLSKAELHRVKEWKVPDWWHVDPTDGLVIFEP